MGHKDIVERMREYACIDKTAWADMVLEAADEIESLSQQLADYKLSDRLGAEREKGMNAELDLLRTQVRDLRGQRDELLAECNEFWGKKSDADYTLIQSLYQRITELEAVIKSHGIPVKTYSGGVAHYCTGIYDTKEKP